jgi:hypothetical protein
MMAYSGLMHSRRCESAVPAGAAQLVWPCHDRAAGRCYCCKHVNVSCRKDTSAQLKCRAVLQHGTSAVVVAVLVVFSGAWWCWTHEGLQRPDAFMKASSGLMGSPGVRPPSVDPVLDGWSH